LNSKEQRGGRRSFHGFVNFDLDNASKNTRVQLSPLIDIEGVLYLLADPYVYSRGKVNVFCSLERESE